MTHRERLQLQIQKLQEVYDEIEYLRDHSTSDMQNHYNRVRGVLPDVWHVLQVIDDKLIPDALANEKL